MAFDLDSFLVGERTRVEHALERALETLLPELPEPLRAPVRMGVTTGGKRLRPILFVAAYRAGDGTVLGQESLYDLAAPLELIHAYSLMHDDLPCMDDAPLRRGKPTPHTVHGEDATMVAAAALIPAAGSCLLKAGRSAGLEPRTVRTLLRLLADAAGGRGMVGGQALDLMGEGTALSREALDDLHRRKTGALLSAALEMGAVAAGTTAERRAALVRYGQEIGLAFQIADDVLDATATAEALGKLPSDAELQKSTYVGLLGVEGARNEAERRTETGVEALREAEIDSPELEGLARFVSRRSR